MYLMRLALESSSIHHPHRTTPHRPCHHHQHAYCHPLSPIAASCPAGLSYLLLADLFANFFRYFVSKPWHDKCLWGGAAQMKHVLTRVNAGMLHLAAAHDKYLSAEKPMITLKVRLQAHFARHGRSCVLYCALLVAACIVSVALRGEESAAGLPQLHVQLKLFRAGMYLPRSLCSRV
jgi:hypothetical protein